MIGSKFEVNPEEENRYQYKTIIIIDKKLAWKSEDSYGITTYYYEYLLLCDGIKMVRMLENDFFQKYSDEDFRYIGNVREL